MPRTVGGCMPRYCTAFIALLIVSPALALEPFPSSFHTQEINTNGTTLYVRIGGEGPAVIMLHGFGDTGDMWAPAAAVLVKTYTVVVPDLRGMGLSAHPDTGYTKKSQALDIVGVMNALKIERADLVTHDIGDMVGYALVAQYPARITKWIVIDAPLPGIGHWDEIKQSPLLWHFNFRGPDEERLVAGRERIYLTDSMTSCPQIRRRSMRRLAATTPRCTHGRMPCMTPLSSLEHSIRTPSITKRYSRKAASSRCRS
jgi:pimeloyl-ACP methyl ester carboxylesterase